MIEPIRNEDASLPLADLDQILAICDQFEADWKAGQPHCIQDDLEKVPELLQDRLLSELQALELELKQTDNRRIGHGFNGGVERVYADGKFDETSVRAARNFMPAVAPGDSPSSTNWKYLGAEGAGVSDEGVSLSYLVVRQSGEIVPLLGPEHHRLLEETFRPGVLIQGRYRIRREVGKGGMGQVYLAVDSRLNRLVAIKVSLHLGEDRGLNQTKIDEFRQAIAEEARLGLNLVHPAIATVYDYGFHDNKPFTVFEYLYGQTLGSKLRRSRGRLTLEEVRPIIGPLAQALDFAHGRHVVHRDLKPENIRATEKGLFKILDLGLAKEFRRNADWSGFAGTPAYASPEQSSGEACDGRTDQYALALIAFELLAGRRLFDSRDPRVLLELHRKAPPTGIEDALPDIPGSIREALSRALSKAPNDRFATCSDFAGALGCQILNTPVRAPEILLETDVEWMTPGRLARGANFAELNAVHLMLTRDAVWATYRMKFRRWPLLAIERVCQSWYVYTFGEAPVPDPSGTWPRGRPSRWNLRLTLHNPDGRLTQLAFRFSTAGECEQWAGHLVGLAGQLDDRVAPESEAAPAKLGAWRLPWPHRDQVAPGRLAPVVLLRVRPMTRYQLLGPVEAKADKRRRAEAGLQLRAAMIGADAVIEVQQERLLDAHGPVHRLSGTAVKAVDLESLFELRSRWYAEQIKQIGNLAVGLVVFSLYEHHIGVFARCQAETSREMALFITLLHAVPLGMVGLVRILRWPQLIFPMAVIIRALSLRPVYYLVGILAGAIGTGTWLRMGFLLLLLHPLNLAILYFGWFVARAACILRVERTQVDRDFRSLVPREGERNPMPRSSAGVPALFVAVGFAVVLAGLTFVLTYQCVRSAAPEGWAHEPRVPEQVSDEVTPEHFAKPWDEVTPEHFAKPWDDVWPRPARLQR